MSIQEAYAFCQGIIAETSEFAAAYKPNSAFFEQFGGKGLAVLKEVISSIPKDIPIILDCKRGDIESTAEVLKSRSVQTHTFLIIGRFYRPMHVRLT